MGRVKQWVGLGPVVKFSKKIIVDNIAVTYLDHESWQSGSGRASPMGMRDGMKTHKWVKWLKKA